MMPMDDAPRQVGAFESAARSLVLRIMYKRRQHDTTPGGTACSAISALINSLFQWAS